MLAGKGIKAAGDGVTAARWKGGEIIWAGKGTIRARPDF